MHGAGVFRYHTGGDVVIFDNNGGNVKIFDRQSKLKYSFRSTRSERVYVLRR